MKKILSFMLIIAVLIAACSVFTVNAAANDTLTVTSRGQVLGEVKVGNEFIYHVALDSAGYSVNTCEAELRCDSKYVELVEYGPVKTGGAVNMDAYCFPKRIRNCALVSNYKADYDTVKYNFSKGSNGIGTFTPEDHYFKIRLKAIAPGTVEIRHYITKMTTLVPPLNLVQLIRFDAGNKDLDPVPYSVSGIESAVAYIGDANGDYKLSVLDATFIQRASAGVDVDYNLTNADVNEDGSITLKDALLILRHNAGVDTGTKVGEWIFESEVEE